MRSQVSIGLVVLLAGCVDVVDPAKEDVMVASDVHPELPGIILDATLTSQGADHVLTAEARNEGDRNYRVQGFCSSPWHERLQDETGRNFSAREPVATCAAFTWEDLQPGSSHSFQSSWNGTRYYWGDAGSAPPEPGQYQWHLRFTASSDEDGPRRHLEVVFEVEVR